MMARRRGPAELALSSKRHGIVPAELLDHESPVWRDPLLFRRWMDVHLPGLNSYPQGGYQFLLIGGALWYQRLNCAVGEWARRNGYMRKDEPELADKDRLRAVGVEFGRSPSLERHRLIMMRRGGVA